MGSWEHNTFKQIK